MKIRRIEHVAIAVSDMGNMTAVLRDVLGLKLDYIEDLHQARVALFSLGDSAIELVQGFGPEARSAKWVAERGQSLYHICLEVEDIDSALDELRRKDIKLLQSYPRQGAPISNWISHDQTLALSVRPGVSYTPTDPYRRCR